MDTIAINIRFLEWDIIALAKEAGELKRIILEYKEKLKKQEKAKIKEKIEKIKKIDNGLEELLLMQEELWQYIQNLEVVQGMYRQAGEELAAVAASLQSNT